MLAEYTRGEVPSTPPNAGVGVGFDATRGCGYSNSQADTTASSTSTRSSTNSSSTAASLTRTAGATTTTSITWHISDHSGAARSRTTASGNLANAGGRGDSEFIQQAMVVCILYTCFMAESAGKYVSTCCAYSKSRLSINIFALPRS